MLINRLMHCGSAHNANRRSEWPRRASHGFSLAVSIPVTLRATSIRTSDLYRIIGPYANQSADIADPVEPIERSSSLSGNLVTERFI